MTELTKIQVREPIQWKLKVLESYFESSYDFDQVEICYRCKDWMRVYPMQIKPEVDTLETLLERNASRYCMLCRIIWHTYLRYTVHPEIIHTFSPQLRFDEADNVFLTEVKWQEKTGIIKENGEEKFFELRIEVHAEIDGFLVKCLPRVHHDLLDEETWLSWQKRLEKCFATHKECQSFDDTRPHRLLDLTNACGPRLIDSTEIAAAERYAALSYCWGGVQFLRTTTDNIHHHKTSIPLQSLPVLFQDIITITTRLAIRYLWIDSLCIVQDSKEDWEVESSKMGQIFSNSFVVLSAVNTPNPHQGIIFERSEEQLVDFIYAPPEYPSIPIWARKALEHRNWTAPPTERDFSCNYLEKRAWCFQENILAKRVIRLMDREMTFKCNRGTWCECSGDECPLTDSTLERAKADTDQPSTLPDSFTRWNAFMEPYAMLDISYSTDRLPAFAGIASALAEPKLGQYLAGIWENHIPECLFWWLYDSSGEALRSRGTIYVAPSWSWASVSAAIMTPELYRFSVDQDVLVEAGCTRVGDNYYGQVTAGFLTLRSYLSSAGTITFAFGGYWVTPSAAFIRPLEEPTPNIHGHWEDPVTSDDDVLRGLRFGFDTIEDHEMEDKDKLVLAGFKTRSEENGPLVWRVLVLQAVNANSVYRRVGIVGETGNEWDPAWSALFEECGTSVFTII